MRVVYRPRAINDLVAIADYLVQHSPAGARAVDAKIRATIDLLAQFPAIGRPLRQRAHVRVMPVVRFPYLIFYTSRSEDLIVLHIRHGARGSVKPGDLE